jgi:hypothetical protein
MSRRVAFLVGALSAQIDDSLRFVYTLEQNKQSYSGQPASISITLIELTYELIFLRIFGFWESFLEQTFVRLMCGYSITGGPEPLLTGQSYSATLSDAYSRLLGTQHYVAWYVPSDMVGRCRRFFDGGNFELVIASATQILQDQSTTRHQIAHVQAHATIKFDDMSMRLVGKRYPGSRPGRFLRSNRAGTNQSWLEHFSAQLKGLSIQIAR